MDQNTARMVDSLRKNPAALQALFHSPDGQELLRRLSAKDNGAALQQAAQSASRGDTADMARMISQIMHSAEGAALVNRIQKAVQK